MALPVSDDGTAEMTSPGKAAKAAPKPQKAPTAQGMGPRSHMEAMKAKLPAKTGKTFEQWVEDGSLKIA